MNRAASNSPNSHSSKPRAHSHWLWTLTGIALGFLALLLYYLSNPVSVEPLAHTNAVPLNNPSIPDNEEPAISKPRFTFYQDLSEPPAEKVELIDYPSTVDISNTSDTSSMSLPAPENIKIADVETQHPKEALKQPIAPPDTRPLKDTAKSQTHTATPTQKQEPISLKQQLQQSVQPSIKPQTSLFTLQAGSFKDQIQADKQRAKLLLQGYEATIREATLANGDKWHRVILGPYEKQKAEQVQATLAAESVESQLRSNP